MAIITTEQTLEHIISTTIFGHLSAWVGFAHFLWNLASNNNIWNTIKDNSLFKLGWILIDKIWMVKLYMPTVVNYVACVASIA